MAWSVEKRLMEQLKAEEARRRFLMPASDADRSALLRRVGAGVTMPERGVFARTSYWDALSTRGRILHTLRALSARRPDWVYCGRAAALVYGLALTEERVGELYEVPDIGVPHLWCEHRRRSQFEGGPRMDHPHKLDSVVVCGLYQAALDAMFGLPFPEALAVADSLLRLYAVERSSFARYVEQHGMFRRGVATVRRAVRHADGLSKNVDESRLRGMIIESGFVAPELQVEVFDPMDTWHMVQADFRWQLSGGTSIIGVLEGFGESGRGEAELARAVAGAGDAPLVDVDPFDEGVQPSVVPSAAAQLGITNRMRLEHEEWRVMRIPRELIDQPLELVRLLDAYGVPRLPTAARHGAASGAAAGAGSAGGRLPGTRRAGAAAVPAALMAPALDAARMG